MKLKAASLFALAWLVTASPVFAATNFLTLDGPSDLGAVPTNLAASLNDGNFGFVSGASLERGSYVTPSSRDYALSYERDARFNQYTVFNASVAHQVGTTTTSFAASADPRLGPLTRLESAWSWGVPDSRAQLRLGDAISNPGTWSHAVRFGGVQFSTASTARADVITTPLLGASGMAVLPSTADLLGEDLRDAATRGTGLAGVVPQAAKPGNVNLPVNDALGRSYVVSRPLFQNISLVPRGQTDFSIEAGRVREDFARRSDQYGSWLVSGTYRYGLGSTATLDAHAATISNEVSVMGLGVSEKVGALGLVSATMATSHTPENSGWLARMGYEVNVKGVNLAVRSHVQSLSFQDLRSSADVEPLRERTLASAGVSLDHFGSISIAGVTQAYGDGDREGILALSHSVPVGTGGGLFSTAATFAPGPVRGSAVLLSVSYPFTVTKRKSASNNTRNVINNVTDQNLLAVLDTTRPLK